MADIRYPIAIGYSCMVRNPRRPQVKIGHRTPVPDPDYKAIIITKRTRARAIKGSTSQLARRTTQYPGMGVAPF